MGVKIKTKLDVLNIINEIVPDFQSQIKEEFGRELVSSLEKGVNPISDGPVKQPQYSDSYKEAIKKGYVKGKTKISPVDLKQTGELLKSLTMVDTEKGVRVFFTDKKAIYHNDEGVGKNKVKRRLLPTNDGEEFNTSLYRRIKVYAQNAVKKATK